MIAKTVFVLALFALAAARPQLYSGYGYGDSAGYSSGYPGYYGYSGYSPVSYSGGYGSYPISTYNNYGYGYRY